MTAAGPEIPGVEIPEIPVGISCLIFDWDGTLANTQEANYHAMSSVLAKHAVFIERDWFDERTGTASAEMIEMLLTDTGQSLDVPTPDLVAARDAAFLAQASTIRELSTVASIARSFRAERPEGKIAVASGGAKAVIEATLPYTGLAPLLDVLVAREDVATAKPAPDLFLLAAERLGALPANCLVYEDSDEGLQAAALAGMQAVDVRPFRYL